MPEARCGGMLHVPVSGGEPQGCPIYPLRFFSAISVLLCGSVVNACLSKEVLS
jgi:hypothetical protein